MGPYMISHHNFTPSFKILSHEDEPQIPWEWCVSSCDMRRRSSARLRRVAARGRVGRPVRLSHRSAELFRCHNMGREGGQKSGHPWPVLSAGLQPRPNILPPTCIIREPKPARADARQSWIRRCNGSGSGRLLSNVFATRKRKTMMLRTAKLSLVLAVALFYSFVVFNNTTDYNSNYQFIRQS